MFEKLPGVLAWMFSNPGLTMTGGLLASAAVIIFNIGRGDSLEMPGGRSLGLSGVLAVVSASFYFFATEGVQGLFGEVASGIFYVVVVGAFVAWYLEKG